MRDVWSGSVLAPFDVLDVHARMPELAYTIVVTTVVRLAEMRLLREVRASGRDAVLYEAAETPEDFLKRSSTGRVDELTRLYGDTAFAAFSDRLDRLDRLRSDRSARFDRLHRLDRLVGIIWVVTLAVPLVIWIISTR